VLGLVKGATRRYATALRAALDHPCAPARRQLRTNNPEASNARVTPSATYRTYLSPTYRNRTVTRVPELDKMCERQHVAGAPLGAEAKISV
jgi:hypothetical protein